MPTLIMTSMKTSRKLDGSMKARFMSFLQKLSADDTTPGLHVEPINGSADTRVRTGRIDQSNRAVMFRLDSRDGPAYVIHGVFPHDDAITTAKAVFLTVNPINGLPQIEKATPSRERRVDAGPADGDVTVRVAPPETDDAPATPPTPPESVEPLLVRHGVNPGDLTSVLGIPAEVADAAMRAPDEDALLHLAEQHEGWLGLMLVELGGGELVASVAEKLEIAAAPLTGDADADVLTALERPAARTQFAFVRGGEELRQAIDSNDFGAWRVFLHPAQRRYVDKTFSGPFRLSGGAGTGKTVVALHRARALWERSPEGRTVLTTYTRNLADSLRESLGQLDSRIKPVHLGDPGVTVAGVDSLAASVLKQAGASIGPAVAAVLGEPRTDIAHRVPRDRWRTIAATASDLAPGLAHESFLESEYATVVLPHRVRTEAEYLRVRRAGRGTALGRAQRKEVWRLVEAYRAQNRVDGALDYGEVAAVAAAWLEGAGGEPRPMADHVLVDEGQDLTPSRWQLLRALVAPGPDDLFIAEDSHQRIYGPKTVLGRYGVKIVGRSQRLTLNYRTTAQNLGYAMSILAGGEYVDLEDADEVTGYRSARYGPPPRVREAASISEELDIVAGTLRGWLSGADDVAPETIGVLVPDAWSRDRVVQGLGERGVDVRAVDADRPAPGRPLVMTMHRAKGLEFSRVVLADVGGQVGAARAAVAALDEAERADAELRQRSLTYVAATRARDELVVVARS